MSTARDCYGSTLKRNGTPIEFIRDMFTHADSRTTLNYLDDLSIEETFKVNNTLVKGSKKIDSKEFDMKISGVA
jgi:hypothetical protein